MKNNILIIVSFLSITLLSGCVTPITAVYESARTLDAGEIELKGSYTNYYIPDSDTEINKPFNRNYGGSIGLGLSKGFNMNVRYESINSPAYNYLDSLELFEGFVLEFDDEDFAPLRKLDYVEFGPKVALLKDHIALSVPIGIYRFREDNLHLATTVNPRLFFTFGDRNDKFEMSIIPQGRFIFYEDDWDVLPALSVGMGFSNDLNRWAIRPEVSYSGFLSIGVGFEYRIPTKKKEPIIYNPSYKN